MAGSVLMNPEQATLLRALFVWGGFGVFLLLERHWAYRPSSVPKLKRWVTNLSLTVANGVLLHLLFGAAILATLAYVGEHRHGLFYALELPAGVRLAAAVVVMDFILYVWHLLNHEMPTLWRLHRVHHSDLNMDVSTATRFHPGELVLSALIRLFLIFAFGLSWLELLIFEILLVAAAQFQHSVIKVPARIEALWWLLFVPPSMHRIHHSVIIRERNSNYGTIFSLWDRLLGTLLTGLDQKAIRIGIGAYQDPAQLRLARLLAMPFTRPVK